MPNRQILAAKDAYIIRSTTGILSPPRMLDGTNALYKVTISHVPGKELTTADALSRAPSKSTSRVKQEEEIELCVENIQSTSAAILG